MRKRGRGAGVALRLMKEVVPAGERVGRMPEVWFYLLAMILLPAALAIVSYVVDGYRTGEIYEPLDEEAVTLRHERAA